MNATKSPAPQSAGNDELRRRFSFYVLLAVIFVIAILSFRVMRVFILPLFLAALLVVIFKPVHQWIKDRCKGRTKLAAGLTTAAILLVVLAPIGWTLMIGVMEGVQLLANLEREHVVDDLGQLREKVGLNIPPSIENKLADIDADLSSLKLEVDRTHVANAVAQKSQLINTLRQEIQALADLLPDEQNDAQQVASPLDTRKWRLRSSNAMPNLNTMAKEVGQLSELALEVGDKPADADQIDRYENIIERVDLNYRLARQELLGGVIWAPIIEYANPSKEQIDSLQKRIVSTMRSWILKATGKTTTIMGSAIMQLFILTIAIFYFLVDGPEMVIAAMHLSPMDDRYEEEMIQEFAKLSRAVVVATLLSAVAQGLLAGFGYWLAGFESYIVLIILTTILAMVPFVGAAAIWVPCALYLAFPHANPVTGAVDPPRIMAAILLALYGFFIVSMADNIIKPWVLKGQSNLHPLFALLSVLGGVQALGPIGVLVGPMLLAFLQSLLKLLNRDLQASGQPA